MKLIGGVGAPLGSIRLASGPILLQETGAFVIMEVSRRSALVLGISAVATRYAFAQSSSVIVGAPLANGMTLHGGPSRIYGELPLAVIEQLESQRGQLRPSQIGDQRQPQRPEIDRPGIAPQALFRRQGASKQSTP
jgi:hypothetical protein